MNDYLYAGARVRAMEGALIGRARMEILLEAKTVQEIWNRLREYGVEPLTDRETGAILREETLLSLLQNAYKTVSEMLPSEAALQLWRYPYDCNNVKAAIKCAARGISPDSMLFDFGTVETARIKEMVQANTFEALPAAMQKAAQEVRELYAKTKNPQTVDLMMDCACYADMLSSARASRVSFAVDLVQRKIDTTNLLTAVRILRFANGEIARLLLEDALIEGGSLSTSDLREWFLQGEEAIWKGLYQTAYSGVASELARTDRSLTAIECSLDNAWMRQIKTVKFIPYGAEVIIAYLLAWEYEVRNLRILLSGREVGLPTKTIRERMRDSYV